MNLQSYAFMVLSGSSNVFLLSQGDMFILLQCLLVEKMSGKKGGTFYVMCGGKGGAFYFMCWGKGETIFFCVCGGEEREHFILYVGTAKGGAFYCLCGGQGKGNYVGGEQGTGKPYVFYVCACVCWGGRGIQIK